jgi:hypothetical protein
MRTGEELKSDDLLWANINLIQDSIGLNEAFIAKELGLNTQKFLFHKINHLSVPFHGVKNLSNKMGLSLEAILQKELDPHQLQSAAKLNGSARIPHTYQLGDGSKSFTVRHILKTAKRFGIYEDVCRQFGLDETSFEHKVDFALSVQLASDILQYIASKVHLTESDYSEMSLANAFYFKDSDFGKELSLSRGITEMYDKFLDVISHVEENWKYKIQFADKNYILLNSYPTDKLSDLYKRENYSSYTFTKFRAHMGAHLTKYQGLTGAVPTIRKSIHNGDDYCQFKFDLTNLKPLSA